ncbi:MAG: YfhO family protein, partial [Nitrospinae bacterium]|nr:YfhO family protein [Nitrospinota bacterium]
MFNRAFIYLLILFVLILTFWGEIIFNDKVLYVRDTLLFSTPMKYFLHQAIHTEASIFWNPTIFNGFSFYNDLQSGIFYPLSLIFYQEDFVSALNSYIFLHYFLAAVFFFFLARILNFSNLVALCGTVVYTFNGYAISTAGLLNNLQAYIWLPFIILNIEYVLRSTLFLQSLSCKGNREEELTDSVSLKEKINKESKLPFLSKEGLAIIFLPVTLACSFYAGEPQVCIFNFFIICFYLPFRTELWGSNIAACSSMLSRTSPFKEDLHPSSTHLSKSSIFNGTFFLILFLVIFGTIILIIPAFFPALEGYQHSVRSMSELGYQHATQYSLALENLVELFYPLDFSQSLMTTFEIGKGE